MNRHSFIKLFAAAAAVMALPAIPMLLVVSEAPFPTLDALSWGYAKIECHDASVNEIRIHTKDEASLYAIASGLFDREDDPSRRQKGVVGYLWGATVRTDARIPRSRVKIISDTYPPIAHYKAMPTPIIAWV